MARPPKIKKLTDEQLAQVEALAACLTRAQIADYFGVSHATWIELEKRQPEISRRYKIGLSRTISDVASNLISKAKSGNLSAATFFLKTRAGWRETRDMDDLEDGSTVKPDHILEIRVVDAND